MAQDFTKEFAKTGAEDGQGQAGDILIGTKGDRQNRVDQAAESSTQKSEDKGEDRGQQTAVTKPLFDIPGTGQSRNGAHIHHAFHAQVKAA